MGEKKLCYGCMEYKSDEARVCPSCGYVDDTPYDPNYIAPGTILNEHYAVGVMIGHNGEGATYIGYNQSIGCKVLIREYMPPELCSRVPGKAVISVDPQHVVQYKALMAEFTELGKNLAQLRSVNHINPTLDLFAQNNTTYAVYEYLEGNTLVDFLKDNAGELTWQQVSAMFPTFFTSLSLVHNSGIIHRAISPETIYVTEKGELRLAGFCIPSVRTVGTEVTPEMFHGYAAPEQYSVSVKQGTWTDVYGICAVLYRILTGCKPTDAQSRMQNDNLCAPHEMNPNIPRHVSRAIMKGLSLFTEDRIRTVTDLVTALFEQQSEPEPRPAVNPNPQRRPAPQHEQRRQQPYRDYDEKGYDNEAHENVIDRIKIPVIIGVLLTCVLLVIGIVVLNFLDMSPVPGAENSSRIVVTTPPSTEESGGATSDVVLETTQEASGDSQMPDLIGKNYESKKSQLETDGWLYLNAVYAYSDKYKAGLIIDQSIKAGTPFTSGATVEVTVSKGPSSIELPDFEGKTLKEYEAILENLGLTNYNTEIQTDYDKKNGMVVGLSREVGEEFDLTGSETLKIYYISNPETTAPPLYTTAPPLETEPEEETTEEEEIPTLPVEETDPPENLDPPPAPPVPEE